MKKTIDAEKAIEYSIENLPQYRVPVLLRVNLKKLMLTPAFALWQLILTLVVLMCSPAAIGWLGHQIYMPFTRGTSILMYSAIGFLVVGLISMISVLLIFQNREEGKSYGARVDSWINFLFPR